PRSGAVLGRASIGVGGLEDTAAPALAASGQIYDSTSNLVAPGTAADDFANWGDEISDGARMVHQPLTTRPNPYFADPAASPGSGWEWRGNGAPGSSQGAWYNPATRESLHPDLGHPGPIGAHFDWIAPDGSRFRIFPDGRMEPK
ncbi:MAG: hypothetical protein GY701_01200, partial [Sulfitobacter sp.]|nr:hypothetical protein [Sulfitobacter sp.]